ncbi:subtilase family protein [Natranaerovirga pectinivora]|uniref:Subtilase family protein n=1 Tax=Natranaerovirga pectinivora TaxID=682400 RepID=A0A4R3MMU2_9FIRM|nr:S8 family peptidase [Natranaerovirga pectinivora]TCT16299.1 subtilase family protein [Natranaerovirga pectinivora]
MDENNKIEKTEFVPVNCREAIVSNEFADFIVQYEANITDALIAYNAPCYQIIDERYAVLHTPLGPIAQDPALIDISVIPRLFGPYGVSSIDDAGILMLHNQPYLPLRGNGIIIGFVDSGIDYTHPSFIYDNNTSKILSIWDQTIQIGSPPLNFQYGTEYRMEEINLALQSENPLEVVPSVDELGHGTFLAGVAAGRSTGDGRIIGAAPDAEIIMVKLKPGKQFLRDLYLVNEDAVVYQDNDIMMGVKYLMQQAEALDRPLVICLGVGTNQGAHDGTSILEEYVNEIANNFGYVVVVPSGNEANLRHHALGEYPVGVPYEDIEITVAPGERGFSIQVWAYTPDIYSIAILSPTGEFVSRLPPRLGRRDEIQLVLERTVINVENILVEPRTGDQLILVRFLEPTEGMWTIRLFGDVVVVGRYNIWLEREGWINPATQFLRSNPSITVTTLGTAENPITVGAYNHFDNSLFIGSGRGPTRDGRLKPDIVAPGVNVLGPMPNNQIGIMTGTSVAAAHVAGGAALLLEWGILLGNNPMLNTTTVKKMLVRGAIRRPQFDYPNNQWGYGTLNLINTLEILRG